MPPKQASDVALPTTNRPDHTRFTMDVVPFTQLMDLEMAGMEEEGDAQKGAEEQCISPHHKCFTNCAYTAKVSDDASEAVVAGNETAGEDKVSVLRWVDDELSEIIGTMRTGESMSANTQSPSETEEGRQAARRILSTVQRHGHPRHLRHPRASGGTEPKPAHFRSAMDTAAQITTVPNPTAASKPSTSQSEHNIVPFWSPTEDDADGDDGGAEIDVKQVMRSFYFNGSSMGKRLLAVPIPFHPTHAVTNAAKVGIGWSWHSYLPYCCSEIEEQSENQAILAEIGLGYRFKRDPGIWSGEIASREITEISWRNARNAEGVFKRR
jgi:hypothetical protein